METYILDAPASFDPRQNIDVIEQDLMNRLPMLGNAARRAVAETIWLLCAPSYTVGKIQYTDQNLKEACSFLIYDLCNYGAL